MWPTWQSSEKTETVDLWTTSQLCHGVLILCRAQAKLRPWWLSESCSESSSASFSRLMTLTCFTLANVTQHLCKGQKCQLYIFLFFKLSVLFRRCGQNWWSQCNQYLQELQSWFKLTKATVGGPQGCSWNESMAWGTLWKSSRLLPFYIVTNGQYNFNFFFF